jgi:glycosyltransferase involved in cell wall biosynthesis
MSRISVVIPTYNSAAYLPAAIESVLNQTLPPLEVIVVDDGSTDESAAAVRRFGDRIRWVSQENRGPAAARNRGLSLARGDLVAFLDADDVWLPEKLAEQAIVFAENPQIGLVHSNFWFMDLKTGERSLPVRREEPLRGRCYEDLVLRGCAIHISTVIVRRDDLAATGGFDERIRRASAEDYDLWIRLARRHEVAYVDRPLALYRVHSSNASQQRVSMLEYEDYVLRKVLRDDPDLARKIGRDRVRRRLFEVCFSIGYLHHDASRPREARAFFVRALQQQWAHPHAWMLFVANLFPSQITRTLRSWKRGLMRSVT